MASASGERVWELQASHGYLPLGFVNVINEFQMGAYYTLEWISLSERSTPHILTLWAIKFVFGWAKQKDSDETRII